MPRGRGSCAFAAAPFSALSEDHFEFLRQSTPDQILAAILSISFVALLPNAIQRVLTESVRSLLHAEAIAAGGGAIAIPYRTDVYWCTRL